MPRSYTVKEREYMAKLAARNTGEVEEQDWEEGLKSPMPSSERMRRKRIRDKADTMVHDLTLAAKAGIIDNPAGMLGDQAMASDVALLSTEDAEDRFWAAIGSPPEEVDIEE